MSRKKKYRESKKLCVPSSSFMRIKSQIRRQRSSTLNISKFARTPEKNRHGEPKKFFFKYNRRIEPALKLCGKYEILPEIPVEFTREATHLRSGKASGLADFLLSLTKQEFKDGKVSNERLHEFLKSTNLVGKIKKPKLIPILEYFCKTKNLITEQQFNDLSSYITNRGTKKSDMHIYISCDPWDIWRMGVGNKSFDSCMNTVTGRMTQCNKCAYNFCDSNMLVCFAEKEEDYRKPNGMIARMIVRVLKTKDGYGALFDRMYGERNLRSSMEEVLKSVCDSAGIKYLMFDNYMYESGHHARWTIKGTKMIGATNANEFPNNEGPYLDNSTGLGFRSFDHLFESNKTNKRKKISTNTPTLMAALFGIVEGVVCEEA